MKGLSCNSNVLSDLPVEDAIAVLSQYGYDAIDVCLEFAPPFYPVPTPHMSPDDDLAKRDRVRQCAEKAGIAIAALNAHTNLSARDPDVRQANTDFVAGALQLAVDVGASVVVTGAGGKDAYGYEQWFFDWACESLRQVMPIADRLGINPGYRVGQPSRLSGPRYRDIAQAFGFGGTRERSIASRQRSLSHPGRWSCRSLQDFQGSGRSRAREGCDGRAGEYYFSATG